METQLLRFRDSEKLREDQTHRDISTNNNSQLNDPLRYFSQFHTQQHFKSEQQKGKEVLTPEMEKKYIQENKEKSEKNHRDAIKEILKERDGKTSSSSEIPLGYDKKQYPLEGGCQGCESIYLLADVAVSKSSKLADKASTSHNTGRARALANDFAYLRRAAGADSSSAYSECSKHKDHYYRYQSMKRRYDNLQQVIRNE